MVSINAPSSSSSSSPSSLIFRGGGGGGRGRMTIIRFVGVIGATLLVTVVILSLDRINSPSSSSSSLLMSPTEKSGNDVATVITKCDGIGGHTESAGAFDMDQLSALLAVRSSSSSSPSSSSIRSSPLITQWMNNTTRTDKNGKTRPARLPSIVTKSTTSSVNNNDNHPSSSSRATTSEGDNNNTTTETNKNNIRQISILGERNSGTTWTTSHVRDCFPSLKVSTELVRHKHWFQHDVNPPDRTYQTLVISVFRNPCYWVDGMMRKSYRSPMHYKEKDWYTFVTTPWTMPKRLDYDVKLVEKWRKKHPSEKTATVGVNYTDIPCQQHFTYNQINSCLEKPYLEGPEYIKRAERRRQDGKHPIYNDSRDDRSGQEPFYELRHDGSGMPYGSIIDMRSDKILNMAIEVSQWGWINGVINVQYDEMVTLGTEALIRDVERVTGLQRECDVSPPQPNRKGKVLDEGFVKWMETYVDWDVEALIGFEHC